MAGPDYSEVTEACASCSAPAYVRYQEQRNGAGVVYLRRATMTQCSNRECEHYSKRAEALAAPDASESKVLSKKQRDAFERREGEDPYEWLARTHRSLGARDLPRLLMLRNKDRAQVEGIQLLAQLRMVQWTRALTFGTFFLGICTIVAAFIVK